MPTTISELANQIHLWMKEKKKNNRLCAGKIAEHFKKFVISSVEKAIKILTESGKLLITSYIRMSKIEGREMHQTVTLYSLPS